MTHSSQGEDANDQRVVAQEGEATTPTKKQDEVAALRDGGVGKCRVTHEANHLGIVVLSETRVSSSTFTSSSSSSSSTYIRSNTRR
jgi:hypothetical protein